MALILLTTVESWCGASPGDAQVAVIHPAVEKSLQSRLRRDLETQAHTHERYDGNGGRNLNLKNWPVTSIARVSIGTRTAFTLINSSTDAAAALIEISATALTLTVSGGTNAHVAQPFTFAANTTLTALIAAINLYAHGWTATISDSGYGTFPSTDLLLINGGSGLTSALDIEMPEEAFTGYVCIADQGRLVLPAGAWTPGIQNIITTYTAGYVCTAGTTLNFPDDLKLLICKVCREMYDRHARSADGLKSFSIGNMSMTMEDIFLSDWVQDIIARYQRPLL